MRTPTLLTNNLRRSSLLAVLLVLGVSTVVLPLKQAGALSGSDFKAGRIIDDGVFTNSSAMTAAQIEAFLRSKVSCDTTGSVTKSYHYNASSGRINNSADPTVTTTRAIYGQRYDHYNHTSKAGAPYVCLPNYVENPTSHANNLQSTKTSISGGESAATIIYNAAQKYSINPEVLIVTLQKEQSLVTDDWPWTSEYQIAMGYACPDSAPCDSAYYGFYNQVTTAAKQFRRYLTYPDNYNFVKGSNSIAYNPNSSCGSSNVTISQEATAALYDYTPYQPNSAALSGLSSSNPGGGNSCSAYGNRNFWWYFNNWFGSTYSPTYAYAADITGTQFYSDSARTTPLSSLPTMTSGETIYATTTVKNTGKDTWNSSFTKLATVGPESRASAFANTSWLTSSRPAAIQDPSISTNQTTTVKWSLTAPATDGTYNEGFGMVADGKSSGWMKGDATQYFDITVSNPYNAHLNSTNLYTSSACDTTLGSSNVTAGQSFWLCVNAKNTGSHAWSNSYTKVATATPTNRVSSFATSAWLTTARPVALMQSSVATGANGYFIFPLTAPTTAGSYHEGFNLVDDGQTNGTMPSSTFSKSITVTTPTYSTLQNGAHLHANQFIASPDGNSRFVMEPDGNLVLWSYGRHTWTSKTNGQDGSSLVIQGGGDLVLYSAKGHVIWTSRTDGNPHATLQVLNNGNLVIENSVGHIVWQTHTAGKAT